MSRRDELLDELIELFLAEGFLDFGVGDLATRLRCSRSTLYLVAGSKEQIVLAAVRGFFRRAAERIEAQVAREPDPGARIAVYLTAVAAELSPASPRFHADLVAYPPAAEIYVDNTRLAARRVQNLVVAGVGAGALRQVDATFVGAAVAQVMAGIESGAIGAATGLDDAAAYRRLADLVMNGLSLAQVGAQV
ncbi:TetR family transcriptional regulator [Nocardioides sp. LMS-CY]|uniref:AcrR family transcriptional regulator n=1 Tax=Nocardioides soli TaxID=1036020 RepID=A0A7W4VV84_9ACTN|nr:TetR/AcrR family transcriptional regulator [Nocardioides sp. LMS-CY]MBB3042411.1 AcrR family transcriptional regulator [Nocardioides soli]QWF22558.1 TetR family transcriptional regulator [Nocardioides sp. LMS-CY]